MQSFEPKLDGLAVSEEDAKMLVEHLSKVHSCIHTLYFVTAF
jgi:hypothetical protein